MKPTYKVQFPEVKNILGTWVLQGRIGDANHPRFPYGAAVQTSPLLSVDFERGIAITVNSIYQWRTNPYD